MKAGPQKPSEKDRRDRGPRRRQNNGSVKAVSPRHCPATCALRSCCFKSTAVLDRVTMTMSVALLLTNNLTWTTRSKRRPTCSAQLHLPAHDLFWANLRVQLHLPPLRSLDLLISPGTQIETVFMLLNVHGGGMTY